MWEYLVIDINGDWEEETDILDTEGEDEWELVSIIALSSKRRRAYFKRPLRKKQAPTQGAEEDKVSGQTNPLTGSVFDTSRRAQAEPEKFPLPEPDDPRGQ
jgi:hypothetical protein